MRSFFVMTEKIKALIKKYREIILYLIFGVLTTAVSFGAYYVLLALGLHYIASQIISWAAAVAFAFVVNKIFVFEDKADSAGELFRQIWQFVSVRIASGVIETAILWLLVDVAGMSEDVAKIPVAVLTVIINYVASKLLIFRKKKDDEA